MVAHTQTSFTYTPWSPSEEASRYDDYRYKLLCYAILAPNTHNTQPWKIVLQERDSLMLYIDTNCLLPATDPDNRSIYMSQGTFLEYLIIAANGFGYSTTVSLFPQGEDTLDNTGQSPIAHVHFHRTDPRPNHLFDYLALRCTDHTVFDETALPAATFQALKEVSLNECFVQFFDDAKTRKEIAMLLKSAMRVQTTTAGTHQETIDMFRFKEDQKHKYQDGYSFEDMGLSGLKLKLANRFMTRKIAKSTFFKGRIVQATSNMAHSAPLFGVIYTAKNTRKDQVLAGQLFSRFNLNATKLGLGFQPMTHILQGYNALEPIRNQFKSTIAYKDKDYMPQTIFRIGKGSAKSHTKRRTLRSFIQHS